MKKLLLSFIALALTNLFSDAHACRGIFAKPIPIEEAFKNADAVFLGKAIEIKEGFPEDFKPDNVKLYEDRRENLDRQHIGNGKIGRTILFQRIKIWKGNALASPITLVEVYKQNTCEWNYDVQINDEYIIFASHYGNYLTFPALLFDAKSAYTRYNPSKREHLPNNPKAIEKEQKEFNGIFKSLEK